MSRFRLVIAVAATIAITGASLAVACDAAKASADKASACATACASAEKASASKASSGACTTAEKASASKASSGACTTAEKAACASKATASNASAGASCSSKSTTAQASAGASCASKGASASNASSGACTAAEKAACASKAGSGCTTAEMAACSAHKLQMTSASAETSYLCAKSRSDLAKVAPFSFLNEAKADEVNVGIQSTDKGFNFVFAGTNQANVEKAVALANNSGDSLGKPAACAYTRADMVESAGGCKTTEACVSALANCDVNVVMTEDGANTVITADSDEKVAEIHTWLASMGYGAPEKSDSE